MASKMPLLLWLIFAIFLHQNNALTLPKLFKDGMVLQARPTTAKIWGNLDGDNTNGITLEAACSDDQHYYNYDATIQV